MWPSVSARATKPSAEQTHSSPHCSASKFPMGRETLRRLSDLGASILTLLRMYKGQFQERYQSVSLHEFSKPFQKGCYMHFLSFLLLDSRALAPCRRQNPQDCVQNMVILMPDLHHSSSSLYAWGSSGQGLCGILVAGCLSLKVK